MNDTQNALDPILAHLNESIKASLVQALGAGSVVTKRELGFIIFATAIGMAKLLGATDEELGNILPEALKQAQAQQGPKIILS